MRRIEDTAQEPPAGWDPVLGHGVVDAFAAVSAGSTVRPIHHEPSLSVSIPAAEPADPRPRQVAVRGAAICLAVAAAAIAMTASAGRLRRRPDAVTHD
jgi:membrane-anchored mycosin MYCP